MVTGLGLTARLAVLAVLAGAAPARAETAEPPDKSAYGLFEPVPDALLRPFCTDRPPKANLPCTVDAGHFQYEADVLNWTRTQSGGATSDLLLYGNPTLKLGLTNRVDLELNIAAAETLTTRAPALSQRFAGVGDLFLRTKINLAGPEGGDVQAAIIPFVKAPTAAPGIGNGAVEGGAIAPISFALPGEFTLLFDPEADFLRNAADPGRHGRTQFLANLSHALTGSVTAYGEIWGQIDNDPRNFTRQASLDLSLAWLAWEKNPTLQFDAGANIGLTQATPRLQLFLGVSQRF